MLGDGPGRYEPGAVIGCRSEREGGDAGAVDHAIGCGPDLRQEARGDRVLGERGRSQAPAERLDRQRQVEDAGAPAAVGLRHSHAGRAHVDELPPELGREAEWLDGPQLPDRARAIGQCAEHLDDGLLLVGGIEIHGHI